MCELFCMASPAPVTFHVSLEPFARHGGLEGPHKGGWGVAWYMDGDAPSCDRVVLAAAVPSNADPGWRALVPGELVVRRGGTVQAAGSARGREVVR